MEELTFDPKIDHIQEATQFVITTSLLQGHVYDVDKVISIVNQRLAKETDVTPSTAIAVVEQVMEYERKVFNNALKLLTTNISDIVSRGMITEKYLQSNNIELTDENHPYTANPEIIDKLYSLVDLDHIVNLIITKEAYSYYPNIVQIKELYHNYFSEFDKVLIPTMDYYLKPNVMDKWVDKKSKLVADEILFVMYQHDLVLELLGKDHSGVYKDIDRFKKVYINTLRSKLFVNVSDQLLIEES